MRIDFSPLAEQDLEAIADYIAADNPRRALSFVQEIRAQCQRIARNPPGYRLRPELGDGIRSCAHGHYVIFFEADTFFRFRDACVKAGIDAPIIPGILPITSWEGAKKFARRCGTQVPQ